MIIGLQLFWLLRRLACSFQAAKRPEVRLRVPEARPTSGSSVQARELSVAPLWARSRQQQHQRHKWPSSGLTIGETVLARLCCQDWPSLALSCFAGQQARAGQT